MNTPRRRQDADAQSRGNGTVLSTITLTVWHYTSAMGASAGELRLSNLEQRGALTVIDAITLVWMPGTPNPRVGRLHARTGAGARRGAVLGALAGALVLSPVAGAAAGAGVGAFASRLRHTGIDVEFLEEMEKRLVPGTSALLVLSDNADLDAIRPFLERGRSRGDVTLMHAVLSDDAPRALHEMLDNVPSYTSSSGAATDSAVTGSHALPPPDAPSGPSDSHKETP
jgi:uncharacterized membrane protein